MDREQVLAAVAILGWSLAVMGLVGAALWMAIRLLRVVF